MLRACSTLPSSDGATRDTAKPICGPGCQGPSSVMPSAGAQPGPRVYEAETSEIMRQQQRQTRAPTASVRRCHQAAITEQIISHTCLSRPHPSRLILRHFLILPLVVSPGRRFSRLPALKKRGRRGGGAAEARIATTTAACWSFPSGCWQHEEANAVPSVLRARGHVRRSIQWRVISPAMRLMFAARS